MNMHIAPYGPGARDGHQPERERKLPPHRYEIDPVDRVGAGKGAVRSVPMCVYFKNEGAKVEQRGLARGKDQGDKRRDLKAKLTSGAEIDRALAERGLEPSDLCRGSRGVRPNGPVGEAKLIVRVLASGLLLGSFFRLSRESARRRSSTAPYCWARTRATRSPTCRPSLPASSCGWLGWRPSPACGRRRVGI